MHVARLARRHLDDSRGSAVGGGASSPPCGRSSLARAGAAALALVAGCGAPTLTKEGRLAFSQGGGATVVTENGVEFHDKADVPQRVIVRDPEAPWKSPVGFILPASGKFTHTSTPTVLRAPGFVLVLRSSDTRVPSWGGEIFLRVDALAPTSSKPNRPRISAAIVIDGDGPDAETLVATALGQLAAEDEVTVIDAQGPRILVPVIPATHRTLALAAASQRIRQTEAHLHAPDLLGALKLVDSSLPKDGHKSVMVVTNATPGRASKPVVDAISALAGRGVSVSAVSSDGTAKPFETEAIAAAGMGRAATDASLPARIDAVKKALPQGGPTLAEELTVEVAASPSPSHVLEASGGEVHWLFEGGEVVLGDVHAGDARAELLRVSVPSWTPHGTFDLSVEARARDPRTGETKLYRATLPFTYDDDIERIAESRNGDVIAYASALATMQRLHAAFVGDRIDQLGGLRGLAKLHVQSLADMARDLKSTPFAEDARVLGALLDAGGP